MFARTSLLCFVALLLSFGSAHAQDADSAAVRAAFDSVVTANTYTATLENGTLTGPGADWLAAQGRAADHFLMGERHGTVQIPAVAASLYERLSDAGYGPVALELGPYAGRAANEALVDGGYPALKTLVQHYESPPIAFLHLREESKMAARMHEAGATIWGVDYEFVTSLPMHLDALAEQAETEGERAAVRRARTKMKEDWGGEGGKALGTAPASAIQSLRAAFAPRGDERALDRIDELIESNTIYAPFVRGTGSLYESRTRRETLMKERLIEHVRTWEAEHEAPPKVFHKNAHVTRHVEDGMFIPLGGFMSEWARVRNEETFHIVADCNGGSIPKTGQGGGGQCTAWLGGEDSPFADHLRNDKITIIDMRALRSRYFDWAFLSEEMRRAIVSMDAYVAIPDVERAAPLNPLPRGND